MISSLRLWFSQIYRKFTNLSWSHPHSQNTEVFVISLFCLTSCGSITRVTQRKAIGTDGEIALIDALKEVFPDAIHLRCFNHFRKNTEKKLRSLNFTDKAAKEILRDIFGLVIENEHQLGLVDSKNVADFRQKLDAKPLS